MSTRSIELIKYRAYFESDTDAVYNGFMERFKDPDVSDANKLKKQQFVSQNEIRAAINKRISLIPTDGVLFTVFGKNGEEDEKLTLWLNAWLEATNFGDEKSFPDFLNDILPALELDGETALKLILRDGLPKVRRMPDENLTIETEKGNVFSVLSYSTTWMQVDETGTDDDDKGSVEIVEAVDAESYTMTVDGKVESEPHSFGFIPVVLIKREDIEGDPHGRSGVADLIDPQDNVNRTLTYIARANKYGPWGLYCVDDSNAPQKDGDVNIQPGSLFPSKITKVSGEGAGKALFQEKEEAVDALYRIAGISRDKASEMASADQTSGKALVILNAQGKRYVSNLISRLRRGLGQLCQYALQIGKQVSKFDDIQVLVEFPSLDRDDPTAINSRAEMLFRNGLDMQALRELGFDEETIIKILDEAQEEQARAAPSEAVPFEVV